MNKEIRIKKIDNGYIVEIVDAGVIRYFKTFEEAAEWAELFFRETCEIDAEIRQYLI